MAIQDPKISNTHFSIALGDGAHTIEDLGSTNGTFVQGVPVVGRQILEDAAIIRAGQSVFVFHHNVRAMLESQGENRFGFIGKFHTAPMVVALKEAALSERHLLLAGPSGSGKELSACAVAALLGDEKNPLPVLSHNAARFSSEEEATTTLFGVGAKVFSNVEKRTGLIASADNGVLFLDEIHNLPVRVQRSLLRVIEDGEVVPIGEYHPVSCQVRFIFASNAPPPDYGLAPDLLARLRVVDIPSLGQRVADIPSMFVHLLERTLMRHGIEPSALTTLLKGDHYESLCLDRFAEDNFRGIIDLVDRIVSGVVSGTAPNRVLSKVFSSRFADSPVAARYPSVPPSKSLRPSRGRNNSPCGNSRYEMHKDMIVDTYKACDGNLSATVRMLRARGVKCNRRWLGEFIKKWGVDISKASIPQTPSHPQGSN